MKSSSDLIPQVQREGKKNLIVLPYEQRLRVAGSRFRDLLRDNQRLTTELGKARARIEELQHALTMRRCTCPCPKDKPCEACRAAAEAQRPRT